MKLDLYFFLFFFLNCQSQTDSRYSMLYGKEIQFEDKHNYPFTLAQKDFLIINSQEKMDEVFTLIHQRNERNRFPPISRITESETYFIIKPHLKNFNDVSIDKISSEKNILYTKVSEFMNPDFNKTTECFAEIKWKYHV